jgi:uncharacterized membrane protein
MSAAPETKSLNWPDAAYWRGFWRRIAIGFLITLLILGGWLAAMPAGQRDRLLSYWANLRVPTPSFHPELLLSVPVAVQLHVAAAVLALGLGTVIFLLPKGTGFHRFIGWSWVSSMIVVAATSIAMIADFRNGGINPLHAFTAITVVSLWAALTGIRRGNVRRHAGAMTGLYVGGLLIAGLVAFIPGRTMWHVVFGG